MLIVKNISVSIDEKQILDGINLAFDSGSTHLLMGPNGSGKSTLAHAIMGNPLHVVQGAIELDGIDLNELSVEKRAKKGIFLTFQQPPQLDGVQIFNFLYESYKALKDPAIESPAFFHKLEMLCIELGIDTALLDRCVNVGFSGGQKKLLELIQLVLYEPRIVICDELDSGLDVDALKIVGNGLRYLREKNPDMILIVITHYHKMIQYCNPEYVHVIRNGKLYTTGDATLAEDIELMGYDGI
jgi:Fe-S cluster assembly ATP-binding protein